MKFLCKCGKTIHDTTDDLFYKGTIIADQDMASMSRSTYRRLGDRFKFCVNYKN